MIQIDSTHPTLAKPFDGSSPNRLATTLRCQSPSFAVSLRISETTASVKAGDERMAATVFVKPPRQGFLETKPKIASMHRSRH